MEADLDEQQAESVSQRRPRGRACRTTGARGGGRALTKVRLAAELGVVGDRESV
jgi:hypothetical protein